MNLPNLLVPGTQKGGTTTLHRVLSAHPQVFMSRNKEPSLFHNRAQVTAEELKEYSETFFGKVPASARYIGESTAHYFWEKDASSPYCQANWKGMSNVPLIREHLTADLRIVLVLRNPVDRAISGFHHHFTRGRIEPGETILDAGLKAKMGIIDLGFYKRHYDAWRAGLPDAKFFITTTDELKQDLDEVYARLLDWLELPAFVLPDEVKNRRWNSKEQMRTRLGGEGEFPEVTDAHRAELRHIFRDEIAHWSATLPGAKSWAEAG